MYKKLYKEIIDRAKRENRDKKSGTYYERHHIVPDFMFKNRKRKGPAGHLDGNPNSVDNIVLLTFQEHLMCHYYLYEMMKNTHYEHSAGSALQFFFVQATGSHARQRTLSEVDEQFLNEMAHIRQIGLVSISKARAGKMPVVDVNTREPMGSVSVMHPKVISGEWVHHSKGAKRPDCGRDMSGDKNANYRKMTDEHLVRIYKCVSLSAVDGAYFSNKIFLDLLKKEFAEFKRVSYNWVRKHIGKPETLVMQYNKDTGSNLLYDSYYRSIEQRKTAAYTSSQKCNVTDGVVSKCIPKCQLQEFLENNPTYKRGRTV